MKSSDKGEMKSTEEEDGGDDDGNVRGMAESDLL